MFWTIEVAVDTSKATVVRIGIVLIEVNVLV
jgi:hypothetical protein